MGTNNAPATRLADAGFQLPVSVLQIHGTADETVLYDGRATDDGLGYPSAPVAVERFAEAAGCNLDASEEGEALDLDDALPGNETVVLEYEQGCDRGLGAALGGEEVAAVDHRRGQVAMVDHRSAARPPR